MGFLRRLLGRDAAPHDGGTSPDDGGTGPDYGGTGPDDGVDAFADLHRVSVWLRLDDPELQDAREQARVFGMEDRVMRRVYESGVGDHDTNSLERGYLVIRLVGRDADAILGVVTPLLDVASPGSYLAVRRGPRGAGEDRIDIPVVAR